MIPRTNPDERITPFMRPLFSSSVSVFETCSLIHAETLPSKPLSDLCHD